jgi:hypothetical protein
LVTCYRQIPTVSIRRVCQRFCQFIARSSRSAWEVWTMRRGHRSATWARTDAISSMEAM